MELTEALAREGKIVHTTVEVKDKSITLAASGDVDGFGTAVLGGLPKGNILLLGAVSYLRFVTDDADVSATWSGDYSIGTTPTADATLNSTDANVIPSVAMDTAVAKLSDPTRGALAAPLMLDNTANDLELNLNAKIDNADFASSGSAVFTVNGHVHLAYLVLGDDNF